MSIKISLKNFDISAPYGNGYIVTVSGYWSDPIKFECYTTENGKGLWVDGQQREGKLQFNAGKNPAAAIRRYFQSLYK